MDDTIHFFSRYAIEQKQLGDPLESAKAALGHEIIPIVTTSISLAIGFSVLVFSDMMPLVHFGLLSAVVILLAMVSDLLITPAFIVLFKMKNIVTFNDLFFEYLPESFYQDNKIFSRLKPGEIKRLISFGQVRFLEMGARKSIDQLEDKLFVILDGSLQVKKER